MVGLLSDLHRLFGWNGAGVIRIRRCLSLEMTRSLLRRHYSIRGGGGEIRNGSKIDDVINV